MEIRSALEGLATSLACKKMTKECLQQLKNMEVDFERAVAENDVERFVDIDEDFHDVIFQATENDKLIQMFRNLRIQLYRYRMAQAKNDNSMSTIVAHHRSILRALENHDSEEGAAVAQGHIKYQTESILRFIKNTAQHRVYHTASGTSVPWIYPAKYATPVLAAMQTPHKTHAASFLPVSL